MKDLTLLKTPSHYSANSSVRWTLSQKDYVHSKTILDKSYRR